MSEPHCEQTRSLNLQGATNFRDIGGYIGLDGRRVRWRRIFRSDHLGGLTAADSALLAKHQLRRVFDLRGRQERKAAPCVLPQAEVHSLAIEPSLFVRLMQRHQAGETIDVSIAMHTMQQTYCGFILDNTASYRNLFEHLLASDAPLVFHCTAGKDRTGMAAALILHALGVSRQDVMQDYLLTNQFLKVRHADTPGVPDDVLALLNAVREEFLAAAFTVIDDTHGGVDAYLENQLGVGARQRHHLADMYLTGPGD